MPTHAITDNPFGDVLLAIYSRRTILTDAQIKALPTTPIEVVPAPGAGRFIYPSHFFIVSKTYGASYSNVDTGAYLYLDTSGGYFGTITGNYSSESLVELTNILSIQIAPPGLGIFGFLHNGIYSPSYGTIIPYNLSMDRLENLAVRLNIDNRGIGDLTGGHSSNTMEVTVFYSIIDL